jgi:hypothetical protein
MGRARDLVARNNKNKFFITLSDLKITRDGVWLAVKAGFANCGNYWNKYI